MKTLLYGTLITKGVPLLEWKLKKVVDRFYLLKISISELISSYTNNPIKDNFITYFVQIVLSMRSTPFVRNIYL